MILYVENCPNWRLHPPRQVEVVRGFFAYHAVPTNMPALAMIFKLAQAAETSWRRLNFAVVDYRECR